MGIATSSSPSRTTLPRQTAPAAASPCASNPEGWDMDHGDLSDWLRALRACAQDCPLLRQCWERRNALYASEMPAGVIWAGTAFTETGVALTKWNLEEYAQKYAKKRVKTRPARRRQARQDAA